MYDVDFENIIGENVSVGYQSDEQISTSQTSLEFVFSLN